MAAERVAKGRARAHDGGAGVARRARSGRSAAAEAAAAEAAAAEAAAAVAAAEEAELAAYESEDEPEEEVIEDEVDDTYFSREIRKGKMYSDSKEPDPVVPAWT